MAGAASPDGWVTKTLPQPPARSVHSNGDLSNVQIVVSVTLPRNEQATVVRCQPRRARARITHGNLASQPLDPETTRGITEQSDLCDVEIVVPVAFPRNEQATASRGERRRLGARLVGDELTAKGVPAVRRKHDVEVVVAVAPPCDEQAPIMRRQRG